MTLRWLDMPPLVTRLRPFDAERDCPVCAERPRVPGLDTCGSYSCETDFSEAEAADRDRDRRDDR